MKIGLLTVGTEILLGDTLNTNLSSLGNILYNSGYNLNTELTVSDNEEEIIGGFKYLENKNDLVIICGGLGPTEDDITKEVISKYLNLKLILDSKHVSYMEERWSSRGLKMPDINIKQALVPYGAKKLTNTKGTAPGLHIEIDNKNVFILPGPPNEFIPIVNDELVPFLEVKYKGNKRDYRFILFYNQAESHLASEINKFKPKDIDIAYLASKGIIKLRYDKNSISKQDHEKFLLDIKECFNEDILAYENIHISSILFDLLKTNNLTITTVESITGGLIASKLTQNPGISNNYLSGDIVYSSLAKSKLLNVDLDTEDWEELSIELCFASLKKYGSNISISILGEAGPITSSQYPIGKIFICISNIEKTQVTEHKLNGNRTEIIERASNKSIWELIKFIKSLY
ncbi:MAG: hypothetical protein EVA29_01760 [Candidatus Actinomarinales bacterium]|nr:MAG: hypothetical protein EVA29_01760 [Candidatus Actinomarinales bacterium]